MKKQRYPLITLTICLMITLAGCQAEKQPQKIGDLNTSSQPSPEETSQRPGETIYEVGDIISINNTILVVL